MKRTLCKHCTKCKDYEYVRYDRNGKLHSFQYCEGGKDIVALSEWGIHQSGYVKSTRKINLNGINKPRTFHRIFKKDRNNVIDHIEGNRTDNRLRKLREITQSCNSQNMHTNSKSKFPGVFLRKSSNTWYTVCEKWNGDDKQVIRKYGFKTEIEAYDAYIESCKTLGRTINTEIPAYKEWLEWKQNNPQTTLEAFV
jgi:hypothetical protein